jgi:hypothetical protein
MVKPSKRHITHFARDEVELQRWKPKVDLDILWQRVSLN